jgi:quercetin dioxygenase-like cupin family protein
MRTKLLVLGLLAFAALAHADGDYRSGTHVKRLLVTSVTSAGQPIEYRPAKTPEVSILEVIIDAGAETGWHMHPAHGYAYVVSGELEVETEDGKTHRFRAGQAFAEVVNLRHNGRALGGKPVTLLVTFTGVKGKPFTQPTATPSAR